jgi:hypothetical protein
MCVGNENTPAQQVIETAPTHPCRSVGPSVHPYASTRGHYGTRLNLKGPRPSPIQGAGVVIVPRGIRCFTERYRMLSLLFKMLSTENDPEVAKSSVAMLQKLNI